uniref:Uncharacterized protein n=1 Tax=Cacopsylla melanoneura TaxID=428564 RepID=A0A8D8M0Y7_9HEMI
MLFSTRLVCLPLPHLNRCVTEMKIFRFILNIDDHFFFITYKTKIQTFPTQQNKLHVSKNIRRKSQIQIAHRCLNMFLKLLNDTRARKIVNANPARPYKMISSSIRKIKYILFDIFVLTII